MADNLTPAEQFREDTEGAEVRLAYEGLDTFLKADPGSVEDVEDYDAAVVGVPYDGAVSNRPGARYGPRAVRRASHWWGYAAYEATNIRTGQQVDYSQLDLVDCGDVPVFPMDGDGTGDGREDNRTAKSIAVHVATISQQDTFPVVIGGDHSCTYDSIRGFADGRDIDSLGLVQVDTHADTWDVSEKFGPYHHGAIINHIAGSDFGAFENVSQLGIRGYAPAGYEEFAREKGINLTPLGDARERGIESATEQAVEAAADGTDAVYVTFDIDVLDPSVAPGTGTPEPGGMRAEEALTVMETLGTFDAIDAVDLVEVAPVYDRTGTTSQLGARLLTAFLERRLME